MAKEKKKKPKKKTGDQLGFTRNPDQDENESEPKARTINQGGEQVGGGPGF